MDGDRKPLTSNPHASSSLVGFKVMQISMDMKLIIFEVDKYHEPEPVEGVQEITNVHQSTQQSTTRVGALIFHHPPWVEHHTGGRSTPTEHPCSRKGGGCGKLTNSTSETRRNGSLMTQRGKHRPDTVAEHHYATTEDHDCPEPYQVRRRHQQGPARHQRVDVVEEPVCFWEPQV